MYLTTTALFATPVVTFPIGQNTAGLPLGIQLHGRRWQAEYLVAIAQAMSIITDPLTTLPSALLVS